MGERLSGTVKWFNNQKGMLAYSEWSVTPFLKLRSASLSMWEPKQGQNKKYNNKIKISHGVIIVNVVSE